VRFTIASTKDDDPREHSANEFARKFLIPPQHDRTLKSLRTKTDVVRFAKVVGIAPGIVVGRLQWEDLIPHSRFNDLKIPFRWKER
jgi:HTH-type transcriptional regulator / antitoxin HigA